MKLPENSLLFGPASFKLDSKLEIENNQKLRGFPKGGMCPRTERIPYFCSYLSLRKRIVLSLSLADPKSWNYVWLLQPFA